LLVSNVNLQFSALLFSKKDHCSFLELIKKCIYQDCYYEYGRYSGQLKEYATLLFKLNGITYGLKVTFNKTMVQYEYSSSDAQDNEAGIYKKTVKKHKNNKKITNYYK